MLKGVDYINGEAQILSPQELKVGNKNLKARFILIASGSRPMEISGLKLDAKKIISSDDILNLKEIPKSLLIIGGGVIGCEFASLFSILGAQVSIVELMPQLLPGIDKEIAKKLETVFKKRAIKVNTNTNALALNLDNYDLVLLCVGRTAETGGLDLDKVGIKLDKGRIIVNEYLNTSVSNIYAAGDCSAKVMLAHFAAYQGRLAVENMVSPDKLKKADSENIPNCIFTEPQIASVGLTEENAAEKGIEIKVNKFDFLGSGMARILDETEGFVKIISDKKTDIIIGASIIGPCATELIGILTLAVSSRLSISQIQDTVFAHPTLSEAISDTLRQCHGV